MGHDKVISNRLSQKRVLVAGGGGFIGRALVEKLILLGAHVVSLVQNEKKGRESLPGMTTIVADLRNPTALQKALANYSFEYVFNAGGYIDHSPYLKGGRSVVDTHFVGTLNLLDQVYRSSLKRFVQIGSSDEYGNAIAPQSEGIREAPIAPYSAAKVAVTHLIQTLARTENFPGVVARLFLVYGLGQNQQRFLPQIIKGCFENKTFPTSSGEQLRDFCYVEDAVEGLIHCAAKPQAIGHVINVASGEPVYVRSVIEKVVELIGKGRPDFGAYPYRPGENMELYADINLAKSLLGWKPQTNLEDGLTKTIEYYRRSVIGGIE